jgi:large subunit ribosomal protein L14
MVFCHTILKCIDNSGALLVKCLKILGKSSKCRGFPGDYIIVSIKSHKPNKKVKKGEIYKVFWLEFPIV